MDSQNRIRINDFRKEEDELTNCIHNNFLTLRPALTWFWKTGYLVQ